RALIMSYAFRGGSYVFTPEAGSLILAARALSRSWENPRFQRQAGFVLEDWEPFRAAMRDILQEAPRTREEISSALRDSATLGSLASAALGAGSDTLYKPLHWWGDISFGPKRGGQTTFQLRSGGPDLPEPLAVEDIDADAIGAGVVCDYLRSYAPATRENLRYWLTEGLSVPSRMVSRWLSMNMDKLIEVESAGSEAYVLREDLDAMREARSSVVVRLIPGFDPWVMGPGTADSRIVDPRHRAEVTKGSNLVLTGGRVVGTWRRRGGEVHVKHFAEERSLDGASLDHEVRRIHGPDQQVSNVSAQG
ncbi:MAG: DNA glycosylase AlkZ-like family protein, partial [Microbacterium sp.]|uniref:DNA glycosylase AlkZ-like family protein n=2 Tax=Micrococcales TaxID=85006 RepID=UPI003F94DEE3